MEKLWPNPMDVAKDIVTWDDRRLCATADVVLKMIKFDKNANGYHLVLFRELLIRFASEKGVPLDDQAS